MRGTKIISAWRKWHEDAAKRPLRFGRYLIFPGARAKKLSFPQYLAFLSRLVRIPPPEDQPTRLERLGDVWGVWKEDAAKRPIRFGRYLIFPGSSVKRLSLPQFLAFFSRAIALPAKGRKPAGLPLSFQQDQVDFEHLLDIYRKLKPKSVLEIGTCDGGSLYHFLQAAPSGAKVGSIDMMGRLSLDQLKEWAPDGVEPLQHTGNSHDPESVEFAREQLSPIDFLFLDGDHSYAGCRQDWADYIPLMSPNGIVAIHDVRMEYLGKSRKMRRFWEAVVSTTGKREFWAELKANRDYATRELAYHPHPSADPEATVLGIGVVYLSGQPLD